MCLQCLASAQKVALNVLGGIDLQQSTKDVSRWPLGHYGLVAWNDPLLVFPGPLVPDPMRGLSDEEQEDIPEDVLMAYRKAGKNFAKALVLPANEGASLVEACEEVGYDPEEHGQLQWWLMDRLARAIEDQAEQRQQGFPEALAHCPQTLACHIAAKKSRAAQTS